ncbi:hypothetical protein QBC41DRAFT_305993 [Cercophora samala]|uniref:Uncharacterized protein n=1 Tax=Cercophora samala TaxID=330535 RepID=A0AA39Z8R0_9PEZI|nr:hypothetical protein QBC41DRAFT_305993 [Cercophora samala]
MANSGSFNMAIDCQQCDDHHSEDNPCAEPHQEAHLHIEPEQMLSQVRRFQHENQHLLNYLCGAGAYAFVTAGCKHPYPELIICPCSLGPGCPFCTGPNAAPGARGVHEVDFKYGMVVNHNCPQCKERRRSRQSMALEALGQNTVAQSTKPWFATTLTATLVAMWAVVMMLLILLVLARQSEPAQVNVAVTKKGRDIFFKLW